MKDKIMIFIIGVLVGAVISTGAFYIYTTASNSKSSNQEIQMNGGQPPEKPAGEPPEKPDGENGQPPEKPDGDNGEPPEKPSDDNIINNTQNNNS